MVRNGFGFKGLALTEGGFHDFDGGKGFGWVSDEGFVWVCR